ncbi:hypothetical protein GGI42DRAFT_321625 [Trichoderma sp. SZMC 28013]
MLPMSNRPDVLAVCSLTAMILLVVQHGHAGPHSMQCTYRANRYVVCSTGGASEEAPCPLRELRRLTVLCGRYVSIVCSARMMVMLERSDVSTRTMRHGPCL